MTKSMTTGWIRLLILLEIRLIGNLLVACPSGWVQFQRNCYFISELKTYTESKTVCASMNSNLLSIHSQHENDFIRDLITHSVWLGARQTQVNRTVGYMWEDGTKMVFANFKELIYIEPGKKLDEDQYEAAYMSKWSQNDIWGEFNGLWFHKPHYESNVALCKRQL